MSMSVGGLPFRVCVYFATAPDEKLSSSDIAKKFEARGRTVSFQLRGAVALGYLSATEPVKGGTPPRIYSAGPLLLRMLGRAAK